MIITQAIEAIINSILEEVDKQYIASFYNDLYNSYHQKATTLEELEVKSSVNYKKYLMKNLKRSIDESLLETNAINSALLHSLNGAAGTVDAVLNKRVRNIVNSLVTPLASPTIHYKNTKLIYNHYDVLNSVCAEERNNLLNLQIQQEPISDSHISQLRYCFQTEFYARLKEITYFSLTRDGEFDALVNYLNSTDRRDIYNGITDLAGNPDIKGGFYKYIESEFSKIQESILQSATTLSVVDYLESNYYRIAFNNTLAVLQSLTAQLVPWNGGKGRDVPFMRVKQNAQGVWEYSECPYNYIMIYRDINNDTEPIQRHCKQGYWNPWEPVKPTSREYGNVLNVDLANSPVASLTLDTYLNDADFLATGIINDASKLGISKIVDEATNYYIQLTNIIDANDGTITLEFSGYSFKLLESDIRDSNVGTLTFPPPIQGIPINPAYVPIKLSLNLSEKTHVDLIYQLYSKALYFAELSNDEICQYSIQPMTKAEIRQWLLATQGPVLPAYSITDSGIKKSEVVYSKRNQCAQKVTVLDYPLLGGISTKVYWRYNIPGYNPISGDTINSMRGDFQALIEKTTPILGLHHLHAFINPEIWNASEAKAIHMGVMSLITPQILMRMVQRLILTTHKRSDY